MPVAWKATGISCISKYCYFLLRRWWRVLRSSLRCFFLAIRLRRFLITEPTKVPYRLDVVPAVGKGPRAKQQTVQLTGSYSDVKRSLTGYRLSGPPLDRGCCFAEGPRTPARSNAGSTGLRVAVYHRAL